MSGMLSGLISGGNRGQLGSTGATGTATDPLMATPGQKPLPTLTASPNIGPFPTFSAASSGMTPSIGTNPGIGPQMPALTGFGRGLMQGLQGQPIGGQFGLNSSTAGNLLGSGLAGGGQGLVHSAASGLMGGSGSSLFSGGGGGSGLGALTSLLGLLL